MNEHLTSSEKDWPSAGRWYYMRDRAPIIQNNHDCKPSHPDPPTPRGGLLSAAWHSTIGVVGSVLRADFDAASDIDVLVEFQPGKVPGLGFFTLHEELEDILGRKVDLNTLGCFRPPLREKIREQARVVYEQRR